MDALLSSRLKSVSKWWVSIVYDFIDKKVESDYNRVESHELYKGHKKYLSQKREFFAQKENILGRLSNQNEQLSRIFSVYIIQHEVVPVKILTVSIKNTCFCDTS